MSADDIFNLAEDELSLAKAKNGSKNKLGFAVLLKYFQLEGHYPKHIKFIDPLMLNCIANQLNIASSCVDDFDWEDGVIIGSFVDYMVDQEEEDEKRRKKLEQDPDYDAMDDLEEDVENDEDPAP